MPPLSLSEMSYSPTMMTIGYDHDRESTLAPPYPSDPADEVFTLPGDPVYAVRRRGVSEPMPPRRRGRGAHEMRDALLLLDLENLPVTADMVNHPSHYTRGPSIEVSLGYDGIKSITRVVECIEVIRHIKDMRLATAMKYIWRVAFGGKIDDREDIQKAIWYLTDWLDHPQ